MHKTVQLTAIQDATTWQRAPNWQRDGRNLDSPCLAMPGHALLCVT